MEENNSTNSIICQYCKLETPDELNFCIHCDNQIKCLECGTKTFVEKEFCLKCGKPLMKIPKSNTAVNNYKRKVKREGENYEEDTEFSLTDVAVKEIAPFVIRQTMPNNSVQNNKLGLPKPESQAAEDVYSDDVESPFEEAEAENQKSESVVKPDLGNSDLKKFFTVDKEILVAIETDFRGSNWAEQQKNFLILYCKAYNEIFKKPVPNKENFREAATKIKITDPNNFSKYLNKATTEYMSELSGGFQLNSKGDKECNNILKLMNDEKAKEGFNYSTKSITGGSKRSRLSNDDKQIVDSWISEKVDLGMLDIRDVKSGRDAALVGIFITTISLEKKKAIKWNEAMHYLKSKYTTLAVTPEAFKRALNSKENEKLFQRTNDDEYFLSTDGQKLVENWISGTLKIKKEENK